MLRRTTVAAAALLAAGALLLSACTGSSSASPSSTGGVADPDASIAVRLVAEPGNLDIRETAGAALDQILIDNVYQGLVSRTPDQEIVDKHRHPATASRPTASPTRSRCARGSRSTTASRSPPPTWCCCSCSR